jgi:hypothetical protein
MTVIGSIDDDDNDVYWNRIPINGYKTQQSEQTTNEKYEPVKNT